MKKIICLLSILLLVSCTTNSKDSLSVVVPSGAPSLAFYNQIDNSNFYTSSAQNIVSQMFSNNGEDIIVLDTINGIRAINKNADYKLAATITFGNFYIASTGLDENKTMDKDDYIVLFSQNATPDIIFHNIYGNSFDENIYYVDAVSDALACLLKGINISDDNMSINEKYVDYVMIAEPALQIALAQNKDAYIYQNLQDLYYEKNNSKMIQASIFVSNRLEKKTIDDYLDKIKNNAYIPRQIQDIYNLRTKRTNH